MKYYWIFGHITYIFVQVFQIRLTNIMIENFEEVKSPDVLIDTVSTESQNANASPDISDCQTNAIHLEKPLIHDARDKDSPNVKVRSWTLINSESNKCINVTKQSWNSDELANI